MPKNSEKILHPGTFIRQHVIPTGMTVTDAAKKLGVGRPALSNLLNGNSSLSPTMASRLEKSFGSDRQKLLDLQSKFDRHNRRARENSVAVHAYVPSFLIIKARQIEDWAKSNHDARHLLAVLLRKLVHSTSNELRKVDFPGYDNAERKGWDGLIEADAATPWVPEGKSGWEFGTDQRPSRKAEDVYAARLTSVPPIERTEFTFVFVTPRNWPGKTEWARNKQAEGNWKAVRAYDASDLEQWLEESIPAQMWLAEHLGMPVKGFETLDESWKRWEEASDPKMTPAIFEPSVNANRNSFKEWLEKPSEKPLTVAADSTEEALAFLSCLFQENTVPLRSRDLATVFKLAETLRNLASSSSPFIPIVCTKETERELAAVYRRFHCIIVRPRNAIDSKPDITVDLLNYDTFRKGLSEMGINDDDTDRLARESGRSPTILRRRLSKIEAIKRPQWAGDIECARSLIPMALIGAWHTKSKADCEVVSTLANISYQQVEDNIAHLLSFNDSPVWFIGQYRGVASKIDSLFAVNKQVSEKDLTEFFWLAEYVLSENDPALDLPEDQRWAAGLFGKVRDHSKALREGICETLVVLSVHGNNLFQDRLGIDVKAHVASLIRKLLSPLTLDKLLSHDKDLPHYAEAAPEEFLKLLEEDLRKPQPVVLGLLKPAEEGMFSSPTRIGLLEALECLAWKHLLRVSLILAQLSRTEINDNWISKPIASLKAVYWSLIPQTAAPFKDRIKSLEKLLERFPDICWQICLDQLNFGRGYAAPAYRPRWRNDASGTGEQAPSKEINEFIRKALAIVLAWPEHDQNTLGDLVERLPWLAEEDQIAVWDLIDAWADSETDETAKAGLRERIRQFAFTRFGRRQDLMNTTKDRARLAYEKLKPHDPVIRYGWLFAQHWVEATYGDIEEETFDSDKPRDIMNKLRAKAMKEIWEKRGMDGVMTLLPSSNAPHVIGYHLGPCITSLNRRADFLRQCLFATGDLERKLDDCIKGFFASLDEESHEAILSDVADGLDTDRIVRLLRCAPFKQETWRFLNQYDEKVLDRYWQEVVPGWNHPSKGEVIEIIDHLLEAKRPRAAFNAVQLDWSLVETSRLKRLLFSVATLDGEPTDYYKLDAYQISEALNSLNERPGVSPDEKARLEFLYVKALDHSKYGIPNLERQIAESPTFFVQMLAILFKRRDDGQDPPEWKIEELRRRDGLLSAARHLLDRTGRIPGTGEDGKINTQALLDWIKEVRQLCVELGRIKIGDQKIGHLLSKAPPEEDGSFPCLQVCEAMERIPSKHIGIGFHIGIFNSVGGREHDPATKYRALAKQRAFDYPYVSNVLEMIADDFDQQARWKDTEEKIQERLRN